MSGFLKRHTDATIAEEACRRSAALAARGVPTPRVLQRQSEQDVSFERIEGETGGDLAKWYLPEVLSLVDHLHAASVPGLPAFDPFRRIRPRARLATRIPVKHILSEPVPRGSATLHGDLHVGQFMRDTEGKMWIVDLDDMALGPREADLANFVAHLATSEVDGDIARWSRRVWQVCKTQGRRCDREVFARFLRFALVRRHLKLREAGRPDFETEVVAYLRDSSNFSMR